MANCQGTPSVPVVRRLIVNADDFGLSPGVNSGIVAAYQKGILTSTTLLANAPFFTEAAALATANPGLGVGLHLNLVRGRPLSSPSAIPRLVDGRGVFRPFRLRLFPRGFLQDAETEYRRQFEAALSAGVVPSHIDFEKHHAWQSPLYNLACRLAREYGVPAVRNLSEPVAWSVRCLGWPGIGRAGMAALLRSGIALSRLRTEGLHRPERMLGQTHIGGMTETVWLRLVASLPPGTSEVMTHPGVPDDPDDPRLQEMGNSWLGDSRRVELTALLSPRVRAELERAGIQLICFRDLLPPSSPR